MRALQRLCTLLILVLVAGCGSQELVGTCSFYNDTELSRNNDTVLRVADGRRFKAVWHDVVSKLVDRPGVNKRETVFDLLEPRTAANTTDFGMFEYTGFFGEVQRVRLQCARGPSDPLSDESPSGEYQEGETCVRWSSDRNRVIFRIHNVYKPCADNNIPPGHTRHQCRVCNGEGKYSYHHTCTACNGSGASTSTWRKDYLATYERQGRHTVKKVPTVTYTGTCVICKGAGGSTIENKCGFCTGAGAVIVKGCAAAPGE